MSNTLSNGILTVSIADIGAYNRARFDWTGFITQVTLERGQHTFCVPESLNSGEGSGGFGLCNEFGISQAIGYDDAAAGEWFPKPGVGLLQKEDDRPYFFAYEYAINPFISSCEVSPQSITYTVEPMEVQGYSLLLNKTLSLHEDKLTIAYELYNKGSKPFQTEEYVHNFIGIDGAQIGKDYELRLPGALSIIDAESSYTTELLQLSEDSLSFKAEPDKAFYCKLEVGQERTADFNWELLHKPSGTGVRESGDFLVSKIALWGEKHVISPEVFVNISLLPRQSKRWSRTYQFFTTS